MVYRHEYKHIIHYADYLTVKNAIARIATLDRHARRDGGYDVRSVYFDNFHDKALFEKVYGFSERDKYRIRFYNYDPGFLRLEKKSKKNHLSKKESAPLTREQCERLFAGETDFLKQTGDPLLLELYLKMKNERLCPKTIVDYRREAYTYPAGNVRVTFDSRIRSGLASRDLFHPALPLLPAMSAERMVLEVKFDAFLPDIIKSAIQDIQRRPASVSKYALCRAII